MHSWVTGRAAGRGLAVRANRLQRPGAVRRGQHEATHGVFAGEHERQQGKAQEVGERRPHGNGREPEQQQRQRRNAPEIKRPGQGDAAALDRGDTFTIEKNTGGVSDGSNALLLGALQNRKTIGNNAASFNDAYGQLVSTVGNKTRQIQISNTAQTSLTTQIRSAQQSVSGVNQDEETANLLMFQQMYQANAKVIQTASTMFDAVLGISR